MPNVLDETRLSVAQAAARLPGSRGAAESHRATLVRWITKGKLLADGRTRLRLEAVLVGRSFWTSAEALDRFLTAVTADAIGEPARQPSRTPAQRRKASEAAERELIEAGW